MAGACELPHSVVLRLQQTVRSLKAVGNRHHGIQARSPDGDRHGVAGRQQNQALLARVQCPSDLHQESHAQGRHKWNLGEVKDGVLAARGGRSGEFEINGAHARHVERPDDLHVRERIRGFDDGNGGRHTESLARYARARRLLACAILAQSHSKRQEASNDCWPLALRMDLIGPNQVDTEAVISGDFLQEPPSVVADRPGARGIDPELAALVRSIGNIDPKVGAGLLSLLRLSMLARGDACSFPTPSKGPRSGHGFVLAWFPGDDR